MSGTSADLALAHELADVADTLTLERFLATDLVITGKADSTPVTEVDRNVEQSMRALIAEHRPGDAVHGEEFGDTGAGNRRWIFDPIDGTKNYIRGVPVWASLISLAEEGEQTVAVVSAPALGRRWWAVKGHGAWTSALDARGTRTREIRVSRVTALQDASLSYSSLPGWAEKNRLNEFNQLHHSIWRQRAFGDFWSYMLLAEGAVDLACEPDVPLYDLAAVSLIVTEAGGTFTNLEGTPGPAGGSAVASNSLLHEAFLQALGTANPSAQQP